ncbi:MAG: FTR1 family protein, partial [Cyanobacteria bacterium J06555_12]
MDWSSAIPALVVTLREGVEATLAVGIVLAYLNRVGQQTLYRWVLGGVVAGIVGSVVVGLLLQSVANWATTEHPASAPAIEPMLEGIIGIVAIVLLSWMLVWMARQAKYLKGETERAVATVLDRDRGAALGLASLAGIAVLREGVELALFLLAQVQRG